jgi:hypothetical protein
MELPKNILYHIYTYLNYHDSLHFALTCRKLHEIFEMEYHWREKKLKYNIIGAQNKPYKEQHKINVILDEFALPEHEIVKLYTTDMLGTSDFLYSSRLSKIISNLCIFENLKLLQLCKCELSELPNIRDLKKLEILNISDNNLQSLHIPENISLNILVCNNNMICELIIPDLSHIRCLNCSFNNLRELDLNCAVNLEYLDCDNNKLEILKIKNCEKLNYVICNVNRLNELEFGNTPYLTNVQCNNNKLRELIIPVWQNINIFYCKGNNIEKLPPFEFHNLHSYDF